MPDKHFIIRFGVAVATIALLLRGWDSVIAACGAILTAAAPLFAGGAIAYVVNILMSFLERHLLPSSASPIVRALRTPLCLAMSFLLIVSFIVTTTGLLVPALTESFEMLGKRAVAAIAWLESFQPAKPIIDTINGLTSGNILEDLSNLQIPSFLKQGLGDAMGPITEQLSLALNSVTTFFFGLLFSVWLLLDKHHVAHQVRRTLTACLGERRYGRFAHVCEVLDRSYHGYIVRQCAEAAILGVLSAAILFALGFPYALGIAALVTFAAFIPVVGIPVGVCAGTFLVVTDTPLHGIVYLVAMFAAQGLVETFIMPRVGDPRILMSPVWVTVAVTLGGGLCGFIGMISITPLGAAIYQLVREAVGLRETAAGTPAEATQGDAPQDAGTDEQLVAQRPQPSS